MSTRSLHNWLFAVAVLALIALLILTALPLASTAAPRLERQPLESLTALNSTEATESGVPSAASVVQSPGTTTRVSAALRSSPLMFIENVGQFDERARFQVRGGLGTIWLTEDAIWMTVLEQPDEETKGQGDKEQFSPSLHPHTSPSPQHGVNLRLSFPGANPHPRIEPFDRLDTVVSYFIGNDPAQWHPNVPVSGGVRYVDLYPGIDLELTSQDGRWAWQLVCRANWQFALQNVRLRVEGADAIQLLPSPDVGRGVGGEGLRLTTAVGEFTLPLLTIEGAMPTGKPATSNVERGTFEVASPFSSAPLLLRSLATLQDNPNDLLYGTFLGGNYYRHYSDLRAEGFIVPRPGVQPEVM